MSSELHDGVGDGRARLVVELSGAGARGGAAFGSGGEAAAADLFLDAELFRRIVREARASCGVGHVTLTGAAPSLHTDCARILEAVGAEGLTAGLVLDGAQFEAAWPAMAPRREVLTRVSFPLDGATAEEHDRRRGEGSFKSLVRAFSRCRGAGLPFDFLFEVRRETLPHLEQAAMLAARLGAAGITFRLGGACLPGAGAPQPGADAGASRDDDELAKLAADEVAALSHVFRMSVTLAGGRPGADCSGGRDEGATCCLVDCRGRLTLCRADSGGATAEAAAGPAGAGRNV